MKKAVILYIDTSDSAKTIVEIRRGEEKKVFEAITDATKSQNVLPLIQKALDQEKIAFEDLTGIEVHEGPGSFTGVRVGVTVANTLAWALKIPVNNKKQVVPLYSPSKFDSSE